MNNKVQYFQYYIKTFDAEPKPMKTVSVSFNHIIFSCNGGLDSQR